tara:strand:- start:1484 stop:2791 length:1308 start_codon:yes stop_codon:yes gene_type:complete
LDNIVAIVGRPNVGKSTFFNRLIQKREAIVDSQSGVTRDRHYGKSDWNGRDFTIIDTGGYVKNNDNIFQKEIDKQVTLAINEADNIIFMVDVEDGITGMDEIIAKLLRKAKKPVFLTVNKVDNSKKNENSLEFYSLGFKEIYPISAINGSGSGELLDALIKTFPADYQTTKNTILPRFAVVGRPNAGKSSFINALIGEERYIVTDIAGTTRDSIDSKYNRFGFEFNLVDTAGIRRKSKVKEDIEFYSVMRSIRAIEHSDVCILMVDATRGFDGQVQNIFWLAKRNNKGIVIIVNKWDLISKNNKSAKEYEINIKKEISPFDDVPILFVSTINNQRIYKAIEVAVKVFNNRSNRIKTKKLNDIMLPIIEKQPPPSSRGRYIKIKFCTQLPKVFPQFAFYCNYPNLIKDPYKRFVENQIRSQFNFNGVPMTIFFRKK